MRANLTPPYCVVLSKALPPDVISNQPSYFALPFLLLAPQGFALLVLILAKADHCVRAGLPP